MATTSSTAHEPQHLLVDWEGGQHLFTGQVPRITDLVQFAMKGTLASGQVVAVLWDFAKRPPRATVRINKFDESKLKTLLNP